MAGILSVTSSRRLASRRRHESGLRKRRHSPTTSATRRPLRRRRTLAYMRKSWREYDVILPDLYRMRMRERSGTSLTCSISWGYCDNLEKCSNGSPAMHQHVKQRDETPTDVDARKTFDEQRMLSMGLPIRQVRRVVLSQFPGSFPSLGRMAPNKCPAVGYRFVD